MIGIFKKIAQTVQNIVAMPRNISKINQLSEDLVRIERKLDAVVDTIDSRIEQKMENQFLQVESLLAIYNRLPNIKLLPPTRGWAGSPDFLAQITELVLKEKPRLILETGSGVSTVVIGSALELNKDGKVISLDHDNLYSKITMQNIELNEIANRIEVLYCDLIDYEIKEQSWKWYNTDELKLTETIDMLIIDGPPGSTQALARYPAVPLLQEYFSDRMIIVLDDARRDDEVIIIQKWIEFLEENKFEVSSSKFDRFEKGMVVLEAFRGLPLRE